MTLTQCITAKKNIPILPIRSGTFAAPPRGNCHSTLTKASTKPGRSLVEAQWLHIYQKPVGDQYKPGTCLVKASRFTGMESTFTKCVNMCVRKYSEKGAIKCWTIWGLKENKKNLKQPNTKRPPFGKGCLNHFLKITQTPYLTIICIECPPGFVT